MPWNNTPEKRAADARNYGTEWRKARQAALRRAGGRCEQCGHRHLRLQVDHLVPVSQGGTHNLANLSVKCAGDGSCKCHEKKTATEGQGYRANPGRRAAKDPECTPRTRW